MEEDKYKEEQTNKLIHNNIQDTITKLFIALDLDNISMLYPNNDSLTSEKIFRRNICILINYMYELANKLEQEEMSSRLYEECYRSVLDRNKGAITQNKLKEILDKYRFCKIKKLKDFYKEIQELIED